MINKNWYIWRDSIAIIKIFQLKKRRIILSYYWKIQIFLPNFETRRISQYYILQKYDIFYVYMKKKWTGVTKFGPRPIRVPIDLRRRRKLILLGSAIKINNGVVLFIYLYVCFKRTLLILYERSFCVYTPALQIIQSERVSSIRFMRRDIIRCWNTNSDI